MPAKNVVKTYAENSYYHIYNRGVEKRTIFETTQDYKVFLKYLKQYLSPPPNLESIKQQFTLKGSTFKGVPRQPKNYYKNIELISYCLMPNHFHLLIFQKEKGIIKNFMQSLLTRYSMYFNKKYDRVGRLFQGIYKASMITTDNYLLHLTRYIHLNPLEYYNDIKTAYSSYGNYLGIRKTSWIKPDIVLRFFINKVIPELAKINSYKDFVEGSKKDSSEILGNLTLE